MQGWRKQKIKVELTQDDVERQIPDEIEGVPVTVRRNVPKPSPSSDISCSNVNYYDDYYYEIKGGIMIETSIDSKSDCNGLGSACCRVEYSGAGGYYLSANHLWNCGGDATGDSVYQHGEKVGEIKQSWPSHDVALIEPNGNRPFSSDVIDSPNQMYGYETKDQILTHCSTNTQIEKRGINTGATTTTISDYDETLSMCGTVYDTIRYSDYGDDDGNSGGPYFVEDGSLNSWVGIHSFGDITANFEGAAAYAVRQSHLVYPS